MTILIVFPSGLVISKQFLEFIVNYIYQKELKKVQKKMNVTKEEAEKLIKKDEVRKKYLSRVSHAGIYALQDQIIDLK